MLKTKHTHTHTHLTQKTKINVSVNIINDIKTSKEKIIFINKSNLKEYRRN